MAGAAAEIKRGQHQTAGRGKFLEPGKPMAENTFVDISSSTKPPPRHSATPQGVSTHHRALMNDKTSRRTSTLIDLGKSRPHFAVHRSKFKDEVPR